MHPSTRDLLSFLTRQPTETFDLTGRVDDRRYLRREFPEPLPLIISLQTYPSYQHMAGENWLHWHDYFEFFVALSGKGEFCVGDDRFTFHPGDVVLVDPLKMHGVMRMEASHKALAVFCPRQFIAPTESEVDVALLSAWELRPSSELPVLRSNHPGAPAVHQALLRLAEAWFGPGPRGPEVKVRFLEVLLGLRQVFSMRETSRQAQPAERNLRELRLRKALDYLSLHGHETISQPRVAKAAGMSTSRFREFFKETTGWGFARYVIEQRVVQAAKLLRESDESIADIAHRTGFSDQSHLLRCFRAKFGVPPKDYRRQHSGS